MILVVGSKGSGKTDFIKSLGYSESQITDAVTDGRPVVNHLEELVFEQPDCVDWILPMLLEKEVVICCEVGSGIIPALRSERIKREATGRLCILLAREAEVVVRMVCGIPRVIKGELHV